ncbi:MAG: hypothetical protein ACTSWY_09395 [Promethearchaeota archaeon]
MGEIKIPIKEDVEEAKERMCAWWNHDVVDRPVVSYYHPLPRGSFPRLFDWDLAKKWDGIKECLDKFEENLKGVHFGAESIPRFFPNYGPGIMAGIFGVIPKFSPKTYTVWFKKSTEIKDIRSLLESVKLNDNNKWYYRLKRITEYAAKRSQGKYQIAITDLGGILDILSSFLGPTNLIVAMKRQPSLIDTCCKILLEKTLKVYDDLQDIIEHYNDGCDTWLGVWCPKRYYTIQCDFSVMLSPKYFKRFALPNLKAQADHLDYCLYHLDGPGEIKHIDDILSVPNIHAIQWIPGSTAGEKHAGHDEWLPLYKKIQQTGKNIQCDVPMEFFSKMYHKLEPNGLFARTYFFSGTQAKCYLPEFLGGNGGKVIEKVFKMAKKANLNSITDKFLIKNKMDLYDLNKNTVIQEINRKLKQKT